jgi:hypothetical protein
MITNVSLEAMLAAITGTGGEFNGCKLGLNTNAIEPVPTNVLADFVEANYTGYAHSAAVVFGAPALNAAGQIESLGTLTTFQPTDAVTPNMIQGVIMVDGTGAVLRGAQSLDNPYPLPAADSAIHIVPRLTFGDQGVTLDFVVV